MKNRLFLSLLLTCACADPAAPMTVEVVEPEEVVVDTPPDEHDAGPEEEDAGEPVAEAPETIPVAQMLARSFPWRNPRYIAQCRRESRRDAASALSIFSKDEARERARQAARRGELDETLIFARMVYGETGPPQAGRNDDPGTPLWDEAVALLSVIDARRGELSRVEMMVAYGPRRVFPHPTSERNWWVAELQLDGRRPPSWPAPRNRRFHSYPRWRTYGCPRWLATIDAVRRVLRAHPSRIEPGEGPCEERPDHWGGAMDQPRADSQGWRRIQCGTSLNRFYVTDS
jgi:hypothetical protein